MKTFSAAGIFGAGIFLRGGGMTVVNRRREETSPYNGGRHGAGDARYLYADNIPQHPVRSVERANIHESTLHETNVHRNYAARNNVNRTAVTCHDSQKI